MAIVGLDHIQIAIPEGGEEAARMSYGHLIGFSEVAKPTNLSPTKCWFESRTVRLHIGVDPDFTPARKAHPALVVDDLAALRHRIEAAGHETRDEKPVEGYDRFFAFDPFGNRVEFMQPV